MLFCYSARAQDKGGNVSTRVDSTSIWKKLKRANILMVIKGSDRDSALFLFTQTLKESKQIRFYRGMVVSTLGIGLYYYHGGEFEKALRKHEEAYIYCEQWNKDQCRGQIENHIAMTYMGMGNYDEALEHWLNALKFYENDTAILAKASLHMNIGVLLLRTNRDSAALHYLDLAEESTLLRGHKPMLTQVYINKAGAYEHLGESRKSKAYLLKALELSRTYDLRMLEEQALLHLATHSRKDKKLTEALSYIEEGLTVNSIHTDNKIELLIQKGLCHYDLKNYPQAEKALLMAKDLGISSDKKATSDRSTLSSVYKTLGLTYRKMGRYKEAIDELELHYAIKDSLFTSSFNGKISKLKENYEAEQRKNEIAKRELQISRQKATIQRKNTITYGIVSFSLLSGAFLLIFFNNRQRIQRQRSEIATWRASMDGEEKERTRLARQLHDGIGGSLSTVQMWFGTMQKRHPELQSSADYSEAMQLLQATLAEVRETAHNLMPELLLRHGLSEAVGIFCNTVQKAGSLKIEYQYYGYIGQLDTSLELIIYRSIQELIQNIVKHADASFALVQLSRHDNILSVTVEDNGVGMDEAQLNNPGMGLQNIKRNIENLKGQFSLHSEPGKGCTVYFEINIENQEQ